MNELALFAGAGGGILGGHLLGWRTICAVEWEPYPASVLISRQNDGILPPFPVWDDVQTFDGKRWRGRVDVISGGFPCQDISCAGKGAGIDGDRSSMWGHMARIISEVQPPIVLVENSPMLVGRGLARVLGDLAKMGYDAKWGIVGAHHVAAPHKRDRIWVVGKSECHGRFASNGGRALPNEQRDGQSEKLGRQHKSTRIDRAGQMADANVPRCRQGHHKDEGKSSKQPSGSSKLNDPNAVSEQCERGGQVEDTWGGWLQRELGRMGGKSNEPNWWKVEPALGRVAHGVAARVDRLKAIGNGQVPSVAALAWNTIHNI